MHDEAAFLARIHATPDDVAPRLVYADWLEDNDDPRGEFIRIVEEMRKLGNAEEIKTIWAGNGAEFGQLSQADFQKMVSGEVKRWAQVVKASGARLE